jgi:hypothetical protein
MKEVRAKEIYELIANEMSFVQADMKAADKVKSDVQAHRIYKTKEKWHLIGAALRLQKCVVTANDDDALISGVIERQKLCGMLRNVAASL